MSGGEMSLSVYYHTHWDREWYMPFRSYQVRLAEVVDDILERLETGVLPCFMLDGQTVVLEDYLELRPDNRNRLQKLVQQNCLSMGPWYVMPDEFLVGGESLIRNLARGIRESRLWGCDQFTGYLPDTFGHSADMPTIFQHCGLTSSVVWRGINPKQSVFQWQSPSGAKVSTLHLTDGYFQMMLQDWTLNETEKQQALKALVEKLEAVSVKGQSLLPIGGDHLGPVTAYGHDLLKKNYAGITETTPERYLTDLPENLETVCGELVDNSGSFLLPGVYSSRMYLKQANRRLEHRLTRQVEPLLALAHANLQNKRYPLQELDLAWKTLILNHPHDSICGCSVDAVHRENEVRFDQVAQLCDAMMNRVEHMLAATYGTPDDWVVFNTGTQSYTGVIPIVEDVLDAKTPTRLLQVEKETTVLQDEYLHESQRIPLAHLTKTRRAGWIWVENIPPFSVQAIPKKQAQLPKSQVKAEKNQLENERLLVCVEMDGSLIIQDQQAGTKYPGLLVFTDHADQGDSYNSAPVPGIKPKTAKFQKAVIIASGPLVGVLELTHTIAEMNLITRIRLDADSPVLQFETEFVNTTENHKLQVAFETGKPIQEVLAESHLSIVNRQYDPNYRESDHVPVAAWKELKANTGPVQRFFSTNGQSFITEGLCEYEVHQNTVSITLMRAFSHLSKADTGVRGAQVGPPFETPEGQCLQRKFVCRYAWTPTPVQPHWLHQLADQFYGVTWGQSGCAEAKPKTTLASLVQWNTPELIAMASYWLPGKGLVIRLLNTSAQSIQAKLQFGLSVKSLHTLNFLDELQSPVKNNTVAVAAHEVQTVLFAVG
jgi:alpha-mannosidase